MTRIKQQTIWRPRAGDRVQLMYPGSASRGGSAAVLGRTGTVVSCGKHCALVELDDKHRVCVDHKDLVEIKEGC